MQSELGVMPMNKSYIHKLFTVKFDKGLIKVSNTLYYFK